MEELPGGKIECAPEAKDKENHGDADPVGGRTTITGSYEGSDIKAPAGAKGEVQGS